MDFESNVRFYPEDEIMVKISRDNVEEKSELFLIGYDPNIAVDRENIAESSLDEQSDEEDIMINYEEETEN
jgi:hypothetical protein